MSTEKKTCVLAIAAEFERPYWREWAEWHHNAGFGDIWIVTNNWDLDRPVPGYVQTYRRDGQVMRLQVYNEWLAARRWEYDFALVCDVDEFLYLPTNADDYLGLHANDLCLGIPSVHFGDGGPDTPAEGSVLQRFTRCEGAYNRHIKPIVNLKALQPAQSVFFVNPHFVCASTGGRAGSVPWRGILGETGNGPFNGFEGRPVGKGRPFIMHFYTKTLEEWRKRRGPEHMRADCAQYVEEDWFHKENHNDMYFPYAAERQRYFKKQGVSAGWYEGQKEKA